MSKYNQPTMSLPGPPRSATGLVRYTLLAVCVIWLFYYLSNSPLQEAWLPPAGSIADATSGEFEWHTESGSKLEEQPEQQAPPEVQSEARHPIDELVEAAEETFQGLLSKESKDLNTAAARYREKRGRHPPPNFDKWFRFAQKHKAIIVEDFFDQIYHDLGPFWGQPPAQLRRDASRYEMLIKIRNGKASSGSDWFWTQIWLEMIQTVQGDLPDMDLALNAMDEPRVLMPWEDINGYMEKERASRNLAPARDVVTAYQKLPNHPDEELEVRKLNFEKDRPFWKLAIRGCPPDSPARQAVQLQDFSITPDISLKFALPHMYKGYVSNFSASTDFCNQPDLQALHGMMINPISVSTTKTPMPMFGGSKLPTNNEILLPAPMYWSKEERFSGGKDHGPEWSKKKDQVVWRGVATGGENTPSNWRGFQRHRFVSSANGTEISNVENWKQAPMNWAMPSKSYNLASQEEGKLGEWTKSWSNVSFIELMCRREDALKNGRCGYTSDYFNITKGLQMPQQFVYKYLPDIDGNSFSGRYRGFLLSTSLPIKATIFKEWHDSRLIPWKHFVPMDNRFVDFWGIMEYFIGYKGEKIEVRGHDEVAAKMAAEGKEWAEKVLRREDMQVYVFRLLLEYARVTGNDREKMGWVQDLLEAEQSPGDSTAQE